MKKSDINNALLFLFMSFLIFVVGFLLSNLLATLPPAAIYTTCAILTIICVAVIGAILILGKNSNDARLKDVIDELKKLSLSVQYDWLYTPGKMDDVEERTTAKEIWIVSQDLSNDTTNVNEKIISIVKQNLRKGVTYTFIVPDTEQTKSVMPHLYAIFASYPKQLRLFKLSQKTFDFLCTTHIAIFNPNMDGGVLPEVFIELPLKERGNATGHWILVADDIARQIVGRFRDVVDEQDNIIVQRDPVQRPRRRALIAPDEPGGGA